MNDIKKLISSYDRFVPYKLRELLNKKDITKIRLGDQVEQKITILFTDIRGFTSLSERLTPQENFNFINSYLSQMEPLISLNNGFVDKFIGDAIMAIFPTTADDALACSLQMLKQLKQYNKGRKRAGYDDICIGIGLNTGLAMIGTVGGFNRMDGTVISDAVNLCSRIEALTKLYGPDLLVGENTYHAFNTENKKFIRFIDRVLIKGKYKAQSIYEVFAGDDPESIAKKLETKKIFEDALAHFHYKNIETASRLLKKCLSINKTDLPARIYLKRCQNYLKNGIYEGSSRMSDRVSWGKHFELDHDTIDHQHHKLLDASIALIEIIEAGANREEIDHQITATEKMVKTHFLTEESIIKDTDYPLFEYHKQEHDAFLSYLSFFKREIVDTGISKIFKMFKVQVFLLDWIVTHILKEDKNYRKHLD